MSFQEPGAAAAVPEARLGLENDPSIIDPTSSQENHTQQPKAQSHERNISGSSSLYYDTYDIGQTSDGNSTETAPTSQPTTASRHDGAKLKGKEINNVELEGTHEAGNSEETVFYQPRDLIEGMHVGGEINNPESSTPQLTRRERVKQPLSGGNYHPRYYREPDIQANTSPNGDPAGSDSTSTAVSRPPSTRLPSFGAQGNTEEDRRNWERIQAIGGHPEQTNYNPRQALPDPSIMALEPARPAQKRKLRSNDNSRSLDGTGSNVFAANPGHLRLSVDDGSSSSSDGNTPLLSHTSPSQTRQRADRRARPEVVVPRWQPDAEVTICPICGTQFSEFLTRTCYCPYTYCVIGFFVRKHHCRKCGRVVCNACSPHRITIPYQFIVQPPTESDTLSAPNSRARRPTLDPARAGSSSEFESLGGGERVRLCNPCVPDPNTAPPQTPSPSLRNQQQSSPRSTHTRSSSTAATYTSSQGSLSTSTPSERPGVEHLHWRIRREFPQQRTILRQQPSTSPPHARGQPYSVSNTHSTTNNNISSDQAQRDSRIRASTVSHSAIRPDQNAQRTTIPGMPAGQSRVLPSSRAQADLRSLVPRTEHQSRPLTRPPRPQRIAEEDECPVCHQELPSSQLPDSEALRAAHITNCIENAMQGTASTPSPPPQTTATSSFVPRGSNAPSSSTSVPPTPVPIANTPEARMAAREQAHAAVVLGQHSSPSPALRRTGVFPYKATEKDCVDDAECTICLEEFEVGQDMGRLECFCRFHLHCIREWFVNHYGQCPVHHQSAY